MSHREQPEVPIAESVEDETSATVDGLIVGEVDGLVWHDISGVDIVSVTTEEGQVAVPVVQDQWRGGGVVELAYDETLVTHGPYLFELSQLSADAVIGEIREHYSVDLGGPPPGPDPQPLPPWWDRGEQQ